MPLASVDVHGGSTLVRTSFNTRFRAPVLPVLLLATVNLLLQGKET